VMMIRSWPPIDERFSYELVDARNTYGGRRWRCWKAEARVNRYTLLLRHLRKRPMSRCVGFRPSAFSGVSVLSMFRTSFIDWPWLATPATYSISAYARAYVRVRVRCMVTEDYSGAKPITRPHATGLIRLHHRYMCLIVQSHTS
jgi:hypothetical protein